MRASSRLCGVAFGGLFAGICALAFALPAAASPIADTYYGGLDTWHYPTDVIGSSHFEIFSADATRSGNDLQVIITTNFVNHIGESGVGLGALFLGNGSPNYNRTTYDQVNHTYTSTPAPSGDAPNYSRDTFAADPGRFDFAAAIPTKPGGTSGTGTFYSLNGNGTDVVLSNVYNDQITRPFPGNNGYYFRQGQAVGVVTSGDNAADPLGNTVSWSIDTGAHTLTFDISGAFGTGLLGDSFTLAWAMTCANDVIVVTTTPLPAALPLFVGGLGMLGWLSGKRRKKSVAAAGC